MSLSLSHPFSDTAAPADTGGRGFRLAALGIAALALALLALRSREAPWEAFVAVALPYGSGLLSLVMVLLLGRMVLAMTRGAGHGTGSSDRLRHWAAAQNWRDLLTGFGALVVTVSAFTTYKSAVVGRDGYGFDPLFIAADRLIFGTDPWRLTHAVFDSAAATSIIDFLYHPAFLPMLAGYVVALGLAAAPAVRRSYMLAYLAGFLLVGMIGADLLASAGPIYEGALHGDGSVFAELRARLAAQSASVGPLSSSMAADYLLQARAQGITRLGSGISAMPSMHIVLAVLWVLPVWHLSRTLGLVLVAYALLIWAGSVHLGWHYAVDGIVALVACAVIWAAAGRICGLYARG